MAMLVLTSRIVIMANSTAFVLLASGNRATSPMPLMAILVLPLPEISFYSLSLAVSLVLTVQVGSVARVVLAFARPVPTLKPKDMFMPAQLAAVVTLLTAHPFLLRVGNSIPLLRLAVNMLVVALAVADLGPVVNLS